MKRLFLMRHARYSRITVPKKIALHDVIISAHLASAHSLT